MIKNQFKFLIFQGTYLVKKLEPDCKKKKKTEKGNYSIEIRCLATITRYKIIRIFQTSENTLSEGPGISLVSATERRTVWTAGTRRGSFRVKSSLFFSRLIERGGMVFNGVGSGASQYAASGVTRFKPRITSSKLAARWWEKLLAGELRCVVNPRVSFLPSFLSSYPTYILLSSVATITRLCRSLRRRWNVPAQTLVSSALSPSSSSSSSSSSLSSLSFWRGFFRTLIFLEHEGIFVIFIEIQESRDLVVFQLETCDLIPQHLRELFFRTFTWKFKFLSLFLFCLNYFIALWVWTSTRRYDYNLGKSSE